MKKLTAKVMAAIDIKGMKPRHKDIVVKAVVRKFVMDIETKAMILDFVIYAHHKKFHFRACTHSKYDVEWEMTCSKNGFSWDRKRFDSFGYHLGYDGEDDKGYVDLYLEESVATPIIQSLIQIEENYGKIWFDYLEIWDSHECLERFWKDLDLHTFYKYQPDKFTWIYNEQPLSATVTI